MRGLDDLYLFRSVVDCGGISAASRRYDIPKSTIARRLADLEASLGSQLFHRGARSFSLTNFGREIYAACDRFADEANRVLRLAEHNRQRPIGVLHVICPPVLGAEIIDALTADFAKAMPDIRLHLEEATGILDPGSAKADLVIVPSFGPLPDTANVARKLFTSPYTLVVHPDLLRRHGAPAEPQEAGALPCLGLGDRTTDWRWVLRRDRQSVDVRFNPTFTTTTPSALRLAALRGLGIASLPTLLCQDDLADGNLVEVLSGWTPQPVEFFAVYPSKQSLNASARRFLNHLVEQLPRLAQLKN